MTKKRRTMAAAMERFDQAAQKWGWEQDQGHGNAVVEAEEEYKAAKAALEALVFA